jgi:hypothetical protein
MPERNQRIALGVVAAAATARDVVRHHLEAADFADDAIVDRRRDGPFLGRAVCLSPLDTVVVAVDSRVELIVGSQRDQFEHVHAVGGRVGVGVKSVSRLRRRS